MSNMKTSKTLYITGYRVAGKDRRTGEPFTDLVALDRDAVQAADVLKMNATDAIERMYTEKGYTVTAIRKEATRAVSVDLADLYQRKEATVL